MTKWRKIVFIVLVSISAKGADYADIAALMTYPTVFMGIGNLICMPLALAIGRRPVYLRSMLVLIGGAVLAAYSEDYNWHFGARMILGLAAGQSEALSPMMIQITIQTTVAAVYVICASPIAGAIGPANWYNVGAGICATVLVLSIPWVPETRYTRSLESYGQFSTDEGGEGNGSRVSDPAPVKIADRPALDYERYPPRTVWSDLRVFILLFPNVLWAFCLNGLTIGVNIAIGTTYGNIVTKAPYNWPDSAASYVNAGQIIVAFVALPLLDNGSDLIIKWRARRNGGVPEPKNRLLLLGIPTSVGVIAAVIYRQASARPEKYHWFATYRLRQRGILFRLRGGQHCGHHVTCWIHILLAPVLYSSSSPSFGTYTGLAALFGLLGIRVFLHGKKIRAFTGRYAMKERSGVAPMSH
ncbi:major facilitator superfamily transporter [Paraphaeosphaeria minitans]|uniref:Major facilitator superfamily transporter n=1 Tax=Paraphaeosphaeria minitans TaxID=565426 RepID=A0A9P6GGU6_9PLEO|nr:major facilitator superfamily transporter [Paraphaeosphaeria minitans]